MFNLEYLSLTLNLDPFITISAALVLTGFAVFIYRYTIPAISKTKKILLITLRSICLILLLLLLFEPMLTYARKMVIEPVNLLFVDNSGSITIEDGTKRTETVKEIVDEFIINKSDINFEFFTFGSKVNHTLSDSIRLIDFSESATNFSHIFTFPGSAEMNLASITIISDGVITDGTNPIFTAERLGIPVYTIGIGDSASRDDVAIRKVLYNEFIYAQTTTSIIASISNKGFGGASTTVSLFEDDKLIDQQNIILSYDGIQNVTFPYLPETGGEKKISINVSPLPGEFSNENNRNVFYINVLTNKIKVVVIAGSPSPDVSFIKNSLLVDDNLSVSTITQFAPNRFIENVNHEKLIDSAQVIFLSGFPSAETPEELLRLVQTAIREKSKPFFITLSQGVVLNKLNRLQPELPFAINNVLQGYSEVQPNITAEQSTNPIIQHSAENPLMNWNNLPPVFQPNAEFTAKPESEIISRIRLNNVPINKPLILSKRLGSKRAIAVLADGIWKWKLQTSARELDLLDNFILNSVKWLNASEDQKQVRIKTTKRLYSLGDQIEFTAQVYDEAFNPVSDAEVTINILRDNETYQLNLSAAGNGLYDGTFLSKQSGDYAFTGSAALNGRELGTDAGRFNIGDVDIELINPVMDYEFLSSLSNITGGRFFTKDDYSELFAILKEKTSDSVKEKQLVSEVNLWSNEWLLIAVILLFGVEWFIRKREGML